MLRNKRGHDSERPAHRNEEWPPLAATRESPSTETKTQHSNQSIKKKKKSKKKKKQKESCTTMFIAALFTIDRTWKQPKCPLTDEWIQKMWYMYTMEYYSAIKKKNEIMPFVVT